MLTPNIKKLIIIKMSKDALPNGSTIMDGLQFLSSKEKMSEGFRQSKKWILEVIGILKQAGEPNPYKTMSDEDIAGELLNKIEQRKLKRK